MNADDPIFYVEPTELSFTAIRITNTERGIKVEYLCFDEVIYRAYVGGSFTEKDSISLLVKGRAIFTRET